MSTFAAIAAALFSGIVAIFTILSFVLSYTGKEDEHRARFNAVVSAWFKGLAPAFKKACRFLFFFIACIGAAAVVIGSIKDIYAFTSSTEPLQRKEVFMLLLNSMNALVYAGAALAMFLVLVKPKRKEALSMGFLTLTRREGEQIRMTIDPGVNTDALLQHLLRDGITLHVGELRGGKVRIGVEAPKEVLVLRDELVTP